MPGGAGELEAVLTGAGLGALVRADEAAAVFGHAYPAEEAATRAALPVGAGVFLLQRPQRGLAVGLEDALERPLLQRLGGVLVAVAVLRALRQVELDRVEGRPGDERRALLRIDHVVRRGDDVLERADRAQVVVQGVDRADFGHRRQASRRFK